MYTLLYMDFIPPSLSRQYHFHHYLNNGSQSSHDSTKQRDPLASSNTLWSISQIQEEIAIMLREMHFEKLSHGDKCSVHGITQ